MTTQHTPGPWIVGVTVDRAYGEWPVFRLRDMNDADPDGAEVQANARLIAAAPDLLAACERLRQQLFDLHAAIHNQELDDTFIDDSINMLSEGRTAIERADSAIAQARV